MASANKPNHQVPQTSYANDQDAEEGRRDSAARRSVTGSEEYFDASQEPELDATRTTKLDEEKHSSSQSGSEPSLRMQTTLDGLKRRTTSRLWSNRSVPTAAKANDNPRDPFQYTFDPPTSDSDSTTSSDDEDTGQDGPIQEDPQEHRRRRKSLNAARNENLSEEERKGRSYSRFAVSNDFFKTKGRVSKRDGRLKISISETANSGYIAKALGQSIRNHLNVPKTDKKGGRRSTTNPNRCEDGEDADSIASYEPTDVPRPRLNIVIMVIGSRGDIQPFLQVGKILKHQYGHRVRIASHPTFREFVEKDAGLEFFSVGGDPSELMAFVWMTAFHPVEESMLTKPLSLADGQESRLDPQPANRA